MKTLFERMTEAQSQGASVPDQALVSDEARSGLHPSGFDPSRFEPLPMDLWEQLPKGRERSLSAIADVIAYWLKYTTGGDRAVTPDTHVWLNGYEGAPPHWPSVGQLKRWLLVLRDASGTLTEGGDAKQAPGDSLSGPAPAGGDAHDQG